MKYTPGPKELQVKALREQRASRPSTDDLRTKIEEVKKRSPKPKKKKASRK